MSQVILKGPIFTQGTQVVLDAACRDIERDVTAETRRLVKLYGQIRFRYEHSRPPGRWQDAIRSEARAGYHVVTDGGIIYGHWLNGTGSRNLTTRFKGYFMWRKAFQAMERSGARAIAEPIIARAVRFLNG